jgi:hypothetical protein
VRTDLPCTSDFVNWNVQFSLAVLDFAGKRVTIKAPSEVIPWQPTVKSVSNPFTQGPRSAAGLHLGLMQMNEKEESVPVQVPSVEDNLALSFFAVRHCARIFCNA